MKTKWLPVFLVSFLLITVFLNGGYSANVHAQVPPDVYVGIHLGYGDVPEAKALIDRVGAYINFVLIGTSKIFWNGVKLNETFQYAYDNGMSFMSFTPVANELDSRSINRQSN
jgi:hypothetical protein